MNGVAALWTGSERERLWRSGALNATDRGRKTRGRRRQQSTTCPPGVRKLCKRHSEMGVDCCARRVSQGNRAVLAYLSTVDNTTNAANYEEAFRFGF
jgi:hypothetical protein